MMINIAKKITAIVMMLVALSGVPTVSAHEGATGVVKQRMGAMSDMADAMKAMALMVRGKQGFDPVLFIENGGIIVGHSDMIPSLFTQGLEQDMSEASPAIWQQWDDFVSISIRTKTDAEDLVQMAQEGGELRPLTKQFVKLSGGCKACHKAYRKKK